MVKRILFVLLVSQLLAAADSLPVETLKQLKAATVFLKVRHARGPGTGSGFLISRVQDTGLIATNAHVVMLEKREAQSVACVFHSGSREQIELAGEIVGIDESRDLAVLRVTGSKLPEPIDPGKAVSVRETQPVFALGFPFGEALSKARNPEVTISRGTISAFRRNNGRVERIQIDGNLNPGNSGGPVVTMEGHLAGIAVEALMATTISMMIPGRELTQMLNGRVLGVSFGVVQRTPGTVRIPVDARLMNPLKQLKDVSILMLPVDAMPSKPKPNEAGEYAALHADAEDFRLAIEGDRAETKVVLRKGDKPTVVYWFQMRYTQADGTVHHTEPSRYAVNVQQAVAAAPEEAEDGAADSQLDPEPPGAVSAAKVSTVLIRTELGYQTGFVHERSRVWTQLQSLRDASELAVVIPYTHPDDGEVYEGYHEALILYADPATDIAILELVEHLDGLKPIKAHSSAKLPETAWALTAERVEGVNPISLAAFKGRPTAAAGGFSTTLRMRSPARGAPLVDSKGKVIGMLQGAEDDRFLSGVPLPEPRELQSTANRYRDKQPELLVDASRDGERLNAKLAAVFKLLKEAVAEMDFSRCRMIIDTQLARREMQRVGKTLRDWHSRLGRAEELWGQIVAAVQGSAALQLELPDAKLRVTAADGRTLSLGCELSARDMSGETLRALLEQLPAWQSAGDDRLSAAVENFLSVRGKDATLFESLRESGTGGAGIEVADGVWETFLGNPQHNAVFAESLSGEAELLWSVDVSLRSRVAADRQAIYAMSGAPHNNVSIKKFSLATGELIKEHQLGKAANLNPPGLAGKYVLIQRADHSKTKLLCFDRRTFRMLWSADCPEQWSRHEHPTVYKGNVFVNGGSYGGWFGFDLKSGKKLWFGRLAQYDGWTPCLYRGVAYAAVGGVITANDPGTGTELWKTKLPAQWSGWTAAGAIVAAGKRLYITAGSKGLQAFDLESRQVAWTQKGSLPPVVGNGMVYCPAGTFLHAYRLKGDPRWTWDAHARIACTPILCGSTLIASTDKKTFLLNAHNSDQKGTIPAGGDLAIVGRHLILRSSQKLVCYKLK